MYKILNILMFLLIIFFIFNVYKYYLSNNNISSIKISQKNIDKMIKENKYNLPVLIDDTNNVIKFNDSFNADIKNEKKRSFWNLLKFK